MITKKVKLKYNIMIPYQTYYVQIRRKQARNQKLFRTGLVELGHLISILLIKAQETFSRLSPRYF